MISKYAGQYFNISLVKLPTRIWRYDFVAGFSKKVKDDGLVVYEKFVEISDCEKVFEVGFSVNWDGQWCGSSYSPSKNILGLYSNDRDFAIAHNMEEIERGTYGCSVPFDTFSEFRVWERDYITKEESYRMVSPDEFKRLWKLLRTDLIPPRG